MPISRPMMLLLFWGNLVCCVYAPMSVFYLFLLLSYGVITQQTIQFMFKKNRNFFYASLKQVRQALGKVYRSMFAVYLAFCWVLGLAFTYMSMVWERQHFK